MALGIVCCDGSYLWLPLSRARGEELRHDLREGVVAASVMGLVKHEQAGGGDGEPNRQFIEKHLVGGSIMN